LSILPPLPTTLSEHYLHSAPLLAPSFTVVASLSHINIPTSPATAPLSYLSLWCSSSFDSIHPSDSVSVSAGDIASWNLSSACRTLLSHSRVSSSAGVKVFFWNDMKKWWFEQLLIHLMASAGLPLSWVENPEWIAFCDEFIPGSPQTSRKVLT